MSTCPACREGWGDCPQIVETQAAQEEATSQPEGRHTAATRTLTRTFLVLKLVLKTNTILKELQQIKAVSTLKGTLAPRGLPVPLLPCR